MVCKLPPTVKFRQKSCKIQVKMLTFSGKICIIKWLFLWNDNHFGKIQSIYMQFVCEFALENARNSVLELQKCTNFLVEDPQTPLFSQNLVWECQLITKSFIIIIARIILRHIYIHPPPQTSDALRRPWWLYSKPISVLRYP